MDFKSRIILLRNLIFSSKKNLVVVVCLVLVVILSLAVIVVDNQKNIGKGKQEAATLSNPTPVPVASVLPTPTDPTQNWQSFKSIYNYSFKYPQGKVVSNLSKKETDASTSAAVSLLFDPNQKESSQSAFSVTVSDKRPPFLSNLSLKEIVDLNYQLNSTSSATRRMITKPIPILFAGNEGYEYYLESSEYLSLVGISRAKMGKNRVTIFESNNKIYTIFGSLDLEIERVLNSLVLR